MPAATFGYTSAARAAASVAVLVALVATVAVAQTAHPFGGSWQPLLDRYPESQRMAYACRADAATGAMHTYMFGGSGGALMFAMSNATAASAGFRRVYPDAMPPQLEEARMEIVGTRLFVVGGRDRTNKRDFTHDVYALELTRPDSWEKLPNMGTTYMHAVRRQASWTADERYVVLYGGVKAVGVEHRVWAFDTRAAAWELWSDASNAGVDGPGARFNPCCARHPDASRNSALCFGGTDAERGDHNDVWEFFNGNRTWAKRETTGEAPKARRLAVCAAYRGREFLVTAGFHGFERAYVSDAAVHFLDVATWRWRSVAGQNSLYIARDHVGLCGVGEQVYLFGGGGPTGDSFNDLLQLDTSTERFTPLFATNAQPEPVAGHVGAAWRGKLVSLLGERAGGALAPATELWLYDPAAATWAKRALTGRAGGAVPAGRSLACAALRGNVLFVFGGQAADGSALGDTWKLNLMSGQWSEIQPQGPVASPRYRATCYFGSDTRFVVGLGTSTGSNVLADWYTLDVTTNNWLQPTLHNAIPARYGAAIFQAADGQHMLALGYLGDESTYEVFNVTLTESPSLSLTFANHSATVDATVTAAKFAVKRFSPAVAAGGNEVMFCSGAFSQSFSVLRSQTCVVYRILTRTYYAATQLALPTYDVASAYIANRFVIFGGHVSGSGVLRVEPSSAVQRFEVASTALCQPTVTPNTAVGCVLCGEGAAQGSGVCTPAAPGTAISGPLAAPEACAAGQFSADSGLADVRACVACPGGTYAPSPGSTNCTTCPPDTVCTIGSSRAESVSSGDEAGASSSLTRNDTSTSRTEQPDPFKPIDLPSGVVIAVVLAYLAICAVVLGLFRAHVNHRRALINGYFNERAKQKIAALHEKYRSPGFGLSESGFVALVSERMFQPHSLSGSQVQQYFRQADRLGHVYFDLEQTLALLATMMRHHALLSLKRHEEDRKEITDEERERMDREEAEMAQREPGASLGTSLVADPDWQELTSLAEWDWFSDRHLRARPGEPIRVMKTVSGGAVTLVFGLLTILLVIGLVSTYFFNNVVETQAAVPAAVINGRFDDPTPRADISVAARIRGLEARSLSRGSIATGNGNATSAMRAACINAAGRCVGRMYHYTGTTFAADAEPLPDSAVHCSFDSVAEVCEMRYVCTACTPAATDVTRFDFRFASQFTARAVEIEVRTKTGVRNPAYDGTVDYLGTDVIDSVLIADVRRKSPTSVFVGNPPATQRVELTPTYFVAPRNAFNLDRHRDRAKGFVLFNRTGPTPGNEAENDGIEDAFGVPVRVELQMMQSALLIERSHLVTETQVIAALLGGVSGLSALLLTGLQLLDRRKAKLREREMHAALLREGHEFRRKQVADEADPYFQAAVEDTEAAARNVAPETGDFDQVGQGAAVPVDDQQQQNQHHHLEGDHFLRKQETAELDGARKEFKFRPLNPDHAQRRMVAGLVEAGLPLHVALEHVRLAEAVANAGARERALQAPAYAAVEEYGKHASATTAQHE